SISHMPAGYYFGFTAPLLALVLGFGVDLIPLTFPVLAGLLIFSTATQIGPVVPTGNYRSIVAAIRPQCRGYVIVTGAGFGRGAPGSVVYEAGDMPVFVLTGKVADMVERVRSFRAVYFIPADDKPVSQIDEAFVHALALQPTAAGYFAVR